MHNRSVAAGKSQRALVKAVFDLIPQHGASQAGFDHFVQDVPVSFTGHAQAENDVIENRFWKRVRLLKNHAYFEPQIENIEFWVIKALLFKSDITGVACVRDKVVHSVEVPEKSGFSAARRADEGRNLLFRDRHIDVEKRLLWP